MPIYEYECADCHKLTEALLKVGEKQPQKCKHCGGKLTRVISRTSFQLKGGGWGKDLYASSKPDSSPTDSSESASASPAKSEGKSEAKSETKSDTKTDAKAGKSETTSTATTDKPAKAAPAAKPAAKSSETKGKKTG
jgi:putative FmdB family regulatory protein